MKIRVIVWKTFGSVRDEQQLCAGNDQQDRVFKVHCEEQEHSTDS